MKLRLLLPFVVVLLASCSSYTQMPTTPYYPLQVGSMWTYKTGSGDGGMGGRPTQGGATKLVVRVTAHEYFSGAMCAKLEAEQDGEAAGNEHIAILEDGVYRYSMNGEEPGSPVRILKLPPDKDAKWKISSRDERGSFAGKGIIREDSVSVPAGRFSDAVVASTDITVFKQNVTVSNYFVKDVGIVRISSSAAGTSNTLDLEHYLLVTSKPPLGFKLGQTLNYKPEAISSSRGDIKFELDSGPPGMELNDNNEIVWPVPSKVDNSEITVKIRITDGGGHVTTHAFKMFKGK